MMDGLMPFSSSPCHTQHQFYRHPALPWAELRVSRQSPHCYRLHMHAEYSIGIVDAGAAQFQHPSGPEPVTPGTVVLIEPGVWHACNPPQTQPWSYRMLFVQADWLHKQLGGHSLRFMRRALHTPALTAWVDALCQWPTPAQHQHYAQSLLQLLCNPAIAQAAPTSCGQVDAATQAVAHALQILHQHPDTAPSVQALAHASGMSASGFIRCFKAATGVTPGAYRLNLRLNGARRLLAAGAALADTAHTMGFADQAHLQRSFKAHHALTPGRYAHSSPPMPEPVAHTPLPKHAG